MLEIVSVPLVLPPAGAMVTSAMNAVPARLMTSSSSPFANAVKSVAALALMSAASNAAITASESFTPLVLTVGLVAAPVIWYVSRKRSPKVDPIEIVGPAAVASKLALRSISPASAVAMSSSVSRVPSPSVAVCVKFTPSSVIRQASPSTTMPPRVASIDVPVKPTWCAWLLDPTLRSTVQVSFSIGPPSSLMNVALAVEVSGAVNDVTGATEKSISKSVPARFTTTSVSPVEAAVNSGALASSRLIREASSAAISGSVSIVASAVTPYPSRLSIVTVQTSVATGVPVRVAVAVVGAAPSKLMLPTRFPSGRSVTTDSVIAAPARSTMTRSSPSAAAVMLAAAFASISATRPSATSARLSSVPSATSVASLVDPAGVIA